MKNKMLTGIITLGLLATSTTSVYAQSSATVEFTGKNEVTVGDTFKIQMNVKDIIDTEDGVVGLYGRLSFDNTKVEYISAEQKAPYAFEINDSYNYKLAGIDYTMTNGIKTDATIYEFTFKALTDGEAEITLLDQDLTDGEDIIDSNVIAKKVIINEEVEEITEPFVEEKTVSVVQIKNEEQEETVELKEEVVEEVKETKTETKKQSVNTKKSVITKIQETVSSLIKSLKKLFK